MQTQERLQLPSTSEGNTTRWILPSGRGETLPLSWATFVECRRRARAQRKAFQAVLGSLT